ncbi:MAG: hypothetical protein M1820_003968 [Bogoriella megaspora]|nr:MAG: hypothetical protein M1820_003968 [Bogoriella megaspora]
MSTQYSVSLAGVSEIETERLMLRQVRLDDAHLLLPTLSNPKSMEWLGGMVSTIEESRDWIAERLARPAYDGFLVQLKSIGSGSDHSSNLGDIRDPDSPPKIIGIMGSPGVPRIGYIFHPHFSGHGYATEALQAYLDAYWKHVPPRSSGKGGSFDFARAMTDADNVPSRRLLERCGFSLQGIEKNNYDNPGKGGLRDEAFYMIARPGMDVKTVYIPPSERQRPSDIIS